MRQISHQSSLRAQGKGLYPISREAAAWVAESGMRQGLPTVFVSSAQRRNVVPHLMGECLPW